MWLAGVPLEQVQALCGHESITTTEIYVKSRWRGTIEPNRRVVGDYSFLLTWLLNNLLHHHLGLYKSRSQMIFDDLEGRRVHQGVHITMVHG